MSGQQQNIAVCNPTEAWSALQDDQAAQLVDVRTRPEWSFVGVPDLSSLAREVILLEWREFPMMSVNATFSDQLIERLGGSVPEQLFFICRSGARSMEAAQAVAAACAERGLSVNCVNVAEGFEGDLDQNRHRGSLNGWKARELAWQQS